MRSLMLVVSMVGLGSLVQGCAPPSAVGDLGTRPSLGPDVTVRQEWKQPTTVTVALTQSAFLSVFRVAPNQSAELVTLAASDSLFAAGTHVLQPLATVARRESGAAMTGGAYPDLGQPCAVTDFVKETSQISTGPDGVEQKKDVITFATPSTSPPILTCAVPGFGDVGSSPRAGVDRYLLVVATDRPVTPRVMAQALARLDVTGTLQEVSARVAALAAREAGATQWGARAVRY